MEQLLTRAPDSRDDATLYFGGAGGLGEDWQRQQAESVARYQDDSYQADGRIGELFGGFIAVTLDRSKLVLDIGCGLHPLRPHYVKELGLPHFLGIEPLTTPLKREYPCLAGVVAEDIPLADSSAGAAIFATSLDHIEDAERAIKEVLRVLEPGAPLYFWLGVRDPFVLAEDKTFGHIHNRSRGWRKWARILGAPVEHMRLMAQMKRRASDLASGTPLDSSHVRFHTVAGIDREMAGYGLKITRRMLVPGSVSMFVEAHGIQ